MCIFFRLLLILCVLLCGTPSMVNAQTEPALRGLGEPGAPSSMANPEAIGPASPSTVPLQPSDNALMAPLSPGVQMFGSTSGNGATVPPSSSVSPIMQSSGNLLTVPSSSTVPPRIQSSGIQLSAPPGGNAPADPSVLLHPRVEKQDVGPLTLVGSNQLCAR